MDYQRVYDAFIADRRKKEEAVRASGDYFEVHHILPRSLGGSNAAENLIALTAEDHYRAHILLGAIHGGLMWAALCIMHNGKGNRRSRRSRTVYAMLKKKFARECSGPNHPLTDYTVHTIHHTDGRVATGAQFELREQTGLSHTNLCALLRGRANVAHGWCRTAEEAAVWAPREGAIHDLYHPDGRHLRGTGAELARSAGLRHGNLSQVLKGNRRSVGGWYACKETARADRKAGVDGVRGRTLDHRIYRFQEVATGRIVETTRVEMQKRFGLHQPSVTRLVQGKAKTTGGWACLGLKDGSAPAPKLSADIVFVLRHDESGKTVRGNRREIGEALSHIRSGSISPVLLGRANHTQGWRLVSRSDQLAA